MEVPPKTPLLLPTLKSESRESLTYTHLKELYSLYLSNPTLAKTNMQHSFSNPLQDTRTILFLSNSLPTLK